MPITKSKLGACLIKSRKVVKRSFKKEPLFYSAFVIAIILFGAFIFTSSAVMDSLGDFSLLASAAKSGESLFAQPSNNFVRESPNMSFVQNNSLVSVSPPSTVDSEVLGTMLGGIDDENMTDERKEILEYVVENGDTLSSLASKFNISLSTILTINELNTKSVIKPGQKLIILPVTGVVCHVKKGDTLSEIAKAYKGKVSEIIDVNELSGEGDIFIGDILIIPNGKIPVSSSPNYTSIPIGSSYFIAPTSPVHITQGLHWFNAIDFGAKCGSPIYAAAAGTIQKIGYGWNGGAGNFVKIIHPNGVVTMYGHVQTILVNPGQPVSQGEIIALVGGKPGMAGAGKSTGCHVHFDVFGARNPFAK